MREPIKIRDNDGCFRRVHPDELTVWDKNPRKNNHAVAKIAESMKRFGWHTPEKWILLLRKLSEMYPEDMEKIEAMFPLARACIARNEFRSK
jgi:hypothetical protein